MAKKRKFFTFDPTKIKRRMVKNVKYSTFFSRHLFSDELKSKQGRQSSHSSGAMHDGCYLGSNKLSKYEQFQGEKVA